MDLLEHGQYLEMYQELTKSIEQLIKVRNALELQLRLFDENCIHSDDRKLSSDYTLT